MGNVLVHWRKIRDHDDIFFVITKLHSVRRQLTFGTVGSTWARAVARTPRAQQRQNGPGTPTGPRVHAVVVAVAARNA